MRCNYIGLCFLAICLVGGAAAQGFSLQQSMSMTDGFNRTMSEDFLSIPWFEMGLNRSGDDSMDFGSAYSFFSEYYVSAGTPVISGIVSTPVKFDIQSGTPARIYFAGGRQVPYAQHSAQGNELWIQGASDWSQYVVAPAGTGLQLVAFSPAGGEADFYEILQTEAVEATNKRYQFYSGYNRMSFAADRVGRHILLFVLNNQPSNAIVVDVISSAPPTQTPPYVSVPPAGQPYSGSAIAATQTTQPVGYGQAQYPQAQYPQYVPAPASGQPGQGDTPVTIQTSMKGYDVYLDGALLGKEGTGGDELDGVFRFRVVGGQTHSVRIFDGMNNYEKPIYFERGVAKVINVPPAATVYVAGGLY